MKCYFVSDIHGNTKRYEKLFHFMADYPPDALLMGGDLFPGLIRGMDSQKEFLDLVLMPKFEKLKSDLKERFPRIFIILGNDDGRLIEEKLKQYEADGYWEYIHNRKTSCNGYRIYGYSYVPPSPFLLKDWERYDVSRYVDPGCMSPEDGAYSVPVEPTIKRYSTIQKDMEELTGNDNLNKSIFLFHSPPYQTNLDRADLDGLTVEHVPLDVHIGSIALQKFIQERQPLITLHGHVHESAMITGFWSNKIDRTWCFSAAHKGEELVIICFDPEKPEDAHREII